MIYLANDHAGLSLMKSIARHLKKNHIDFEWVGNKQLDETDSYVSFTDLGASLVAKDSVHLGIFSCGTGIGSSIAANRHAGIRAALCHNVEYAKLARRHNNANVLVLGGRFVSARLANQMVDAFLTTPFAGGRHLERISQLDKK